MNPLIELLYTPRSLPSCKDHAAPMGSLWLYWQRIEGCLHPDWLPTLNPDRLLIQAWLHQMEKRVAQNWAMIIESTNQTVSEQKEEVSLHNCKYLPCESWNFWCLWPWYVHTSGTWMGWCLYLEFIMEFSTPGWPADMSGDHRTLMDLHFLRQINLRNPTLSGKMIPAS